MARLQILPLPEGAGDDRPPFALIIDQVTEEEGERLVENSDVMDGFGVKAGARAVAVFHGMTVEIPANDPLPLAKDRGPTLVQADLKGDTGRVRQIVRDEIGKARDAARREGRGLR